MAKRSKRPSKGSVKAAADRAEKRSKGEKPSTALVPVDPEIIPAGAILADAVREEIKEQRKGRPSVYSPELGREICRLIAHGRTLRTIETLPGMPCKRTIVEWAGDVDHPFSPQYARAREVALDVLEDECADIVDDSRNDWMVLHTSGGEIEVENREVVNRSKLRFDYRRWKLGHRRPKVFGPKRPDDGVNKTGDLEAFRKLWEFVSEGNKPKAVAMDATFEEVKP